jgi:hypothetical protein
MAGLRQGVSGGASGLCCPWNPPLHYSRDAGEAAVDCGENLKGTLIDVIAPH